VRLFGTVFALPVLIGSLALAQTAGDESAHDKTNTATKPRTSGQELASIKYKECKNVTEALEAYLAFIKTIDKPNLKSIEDEYYIKKRIFKLLSAEIPKELDPELKEMIETQASLFTSSVNKLLEMLFDEELSNNTEKRNRQIEDQLNRTTDILMGYESACMSANKYLELTRRAQETKLQLKPIDLALARLKQASLELSQVHKFLASGFIDSKKKFEQIEATQLAYSSALHGIELNKNYNDDIAYMNKYSLSIDTLAYQEAIQKFNKELELSSQGKAIESAYEEVIKARNEFYNRLKIHKEDLYNIQKVKDPSIGQPPREYNIFIVPSNELKNETGATAIISLSA